MIQMQKKKLSKEDLRTLMMKNKKRLSILSTLILLFGLLQPGLVLATENTEDLVVEVTEEQNVEESEAVSAEVTEETGPETEEAEEAIAEIEEKQDEPDQEPADNTVADEESNSEPELAESDETTIEGAHVQQVFLEQSMIVL